MVTCRTHARLVKILEGPAGQQFAPSQRPVEYSEGAIRHESSSRRVRASASDCIEFVSAPPVAERPWPNHGGGQRWSLTRSPLRRTVSPLMPRVPIRIMMRDRKITRNSVLYALETLQKKGTVFRNGNKLWGLAGRDYAT